MKRVLFLLLFFSSALLHGQVIIKEIRETNPDFKNNKYVFPSIRVPGNKIATDRINNELVNDFLDIDRKKIKKSIFENVWATKEQPTPRLSDFAYTILNNDKKTLSLSLSAEGCGAYCEYSTQYYSFDIKTGRRITVDTLFTRQGVTTLSDSLTKWKKRMLEAGLKEATDSLNNPSTWSNLSEKEHYEGAKELYERCLTGLDQIDLKYLKFYLVKDKLYIIAERCSGHMNRALDDIGDFHFVISLKDWKGYLSDYGLRLTAVPVR